MANEVVLEQLIHHRVGLERLSSGVLSKLIKHLVVVENDIEDQIRKRFRGLEPGEIDHGSERLKNLLAYIRRIHAEAVLALSGDLQRELSTVAQHETEWTAQTYANALRINVALDTLSAAQLQSIVTARPMQGRFLKDWAAKLGTDAVGRIEAQIRIGMTEGEGTDQIIRRLRGTRAGKYKDGVYALTRNGAETLVRTAVNHVANQAHIETLKSNVETFPYFRWVSVLDGRTSPLCRSRAGKIYKTGEGPVPPGHPRCRSTIVGLPRGTKPVEDPDLDYGKWLDRQSAAVQDDILGPTRGKLFRQGGLKIDRFTNRDGDALTLEQLKQREAEAWARAGLT